MISRLDHEHITYTHFFHPDLDLFAILEQRDRIRAKLQQRADRSHRLALADGLQVLAETHQRHHDARAFKIKRMHGMHISHADLDRGIHRIQISAQCADGHQRIHIGHPMQERRDAAHIEILAHDQQDRGQDELDHREIERMRLIVDDIRQRQRERQHMRHADIQQDRAQHEHDDHRRIALLLLLDRFRLQRLGLIAGLVDGGEHLAELDH